MEADTSVNRETELVTTTRSNLAENDLGIYNVSARDRDDREIEGTAFLSIGLRERGRDLGLEVWLSCVFFFFPPSADSAALHQLHLGQSGNHILQKLPLTVQRCANDSAVSYARNGGA